jgi:signal transduction histidine kinase
MGHAQLQAIDAGLAMVVALLGWYAASESPAPSRSGWHEPMWVSVVAGIALAAPVAARRRWPVIAAGVAVIVAVLSLASGVIPDFAGSAPMVAVGLVLYTLGAVVDARRSASVALVCMVLIAAGFIYAARSPFEASFATLVLCVCWAVGRTVRERRAYAARTAELATAVALDEERLRIAREIHDIVAHSMSLIAVKATIADHVADEHPQEMRDALRVIASTSRIALGDMRVALGALRAEPAYAPTPGMADLAGLADAAQSAGVAVEMRIQGDTALPDGVAQAVFRIVQETLTNVVKHAAATQCRVEINIGPDEVRIEAVDDGSPHETHPSTPVDSPRKRAGSVPTPLPASRSSPGAVRSNVSPPGASALGASHFGASPTGASHSDALPASASPPGGLGSRALPASASRIGASNSDALPPIASLSGVSRSGASPPDASSPGAGGFVGLPSGASPGAGGFDASPPDASSPAGAAGLDALPSGASSFGASQCGQGLIGMRERVALFGGRFAAGPEHPRGWRVSATLRYER